MEPLPAAPALTEFPKELPITQELDLPTQILFANNRSWHNRMQLAGNLHLAPVVQDMLAHDPMENVTSELAKNPTLDPELQIELAEDQYTSIRAALAQNHSLIPSVQMALTNDAEDLVRYCLAANPNLNVQVALVLYESSRQPEIIHQILAVDNPATYLAAQKAERIHAMLTLDTSIG